MKAIIFFAIILFPLVIMNSCSNKSEKRAQDFIYKNYFLIDSITKTLDPIKESQQIVDLNEIPDSLLGKWVAPLRKKGHQNKMVSYQYQRNNYHVVIIMIVDEIYVDKETRATEILQSSQYVLTLKTDGNLIDKLKVEEGLSKDHLDDFFVDGKEVMSQHKWSEFYQDTIKVYDLTSYIKKTILSEREDYIETPAGKVMGALETVLQEELEGTDQTTYLIDMTGKIRKVSEKKGELKKLSEHTGERIKEK